MRPTPFVLLAAVLAPPPHAPAAGSVDGDEPVRDRVTKSVELDAGARIEVSTIPGPVEIETVSGHRAEIEVIRSAPSQADFDCGGVLIDTSPKKIEIRSVDHCSIVRGTQRVKLTLPRDADIELDNIAGGVRLGPTDGMVRLESIAGHVEAAGLREAKLSSLAAGLDLDVSRLGEGGIRVSSVTGGIDLKVGPGVDAELETRSVVGRIRSDLPGLRLIDDDGTDQRAVLGAGRGKIVLESVVGGVRIHG